MDENYHTLSQWVGHVASGFAVVGSFLGYVPSLLGASVALIWYTIEIKESKTYRNWRARRTQRKILKLRAKLMLLEGYSQDEVMSSQQPSAETDA